MSRIIWVTALLLAGLAAVTQPRWWPAVRTFSQNLVAPAGGVAGHDDHDHAHEEDPNSLTLSPQAQKALGLNNETLKPIQLETYRRQLTVPGIVVQRPGRTRVEASTPIAGVITHVHAVQGETVKPGTLLFQLRITADALVTTQTELLKTVGELDVERREITRLTTAVDSGAVPTRNLLDRQYARDKLESLLNAQREGLRLLGLSERQIEDIVVNRKVLKELQITAPEPDDHSAHELKLIAGDAAPEANKPSHESGSDAHGPLLLSDVRVHKGQTVTAGQTLAVMIDYAELYVEGRAFEQDAHFMTQAAQNDWPVTGVVDGQDGRPRFVNDLHFAYTGSEIDITARTLPFYVRLPNAIERSVTLPDGQQFNDWRFRLGQRMQLKVPVEEFPNRFILPAEAVARDGIDYYVFRKFGDRFQRVPVTVEFRDAHSVVIANDFQLYPGNVIAMQGAHQMQMALKNRSGGGVDPHAGHNH